MAGFDRSKYRPTQVAALKMQNEQHETIRPTSGNDRNYIQIKDGENKVRIFPCHPEGGGKTYSEAKCISFLSVTTPKRDDKGKLIEGQFEIKRRPIFNSKVHGNIKIDLVEEYMKIAKDIAIPNFTSDVDKKETIWRHITGMNGVRPSDSWVVYASKFENGVWSNAGLLEFKKTVKNDLQEIAMDYVQNDLISPDPFTDPDEGIAIIITKSGKGLDTSYKTNLHSARNGKSLEYISTPLTDEQLEYFSKLEPLHKLYSNSFKKRDLELQIEGLSNFEKELASKPLRTKGGVDFIANIGVFQYPEFQNSIDKLIDLFPDDIESDVDNDDHEEEIIETKNEVINKTSISPDMNSASARLNEIRKKLGTAK